MIVPLSLIEGLGDVATGEGGRLTIMHLEEGAASSEEGSIDFKNKWFGRVRDMEDGCLGKALFEVVKRVLTVCGPAEGLRLAFEVVKRLGDEGVVANELTIVICEACKFANLFSIDRLWPFEDGVNFGRVRQKLTRANNKSKILYFLFMEVALLRIEVEVVLAHSLKHKASTVDELGKVIGHNEEIVHVD